MSRSTEELGGRETEVAGLMENGFRAFNGRRLSGAARLLVDDVLADDVTVGVTLTGALTPAGLGMSVLLPLVEAGFIDWIVSTGANLYHDTHFGIGLSLHQGRADLDDVALREDGVVRIYDILFDYSVLLETDAFFRQILESPEFEREMGTADFHLLAGRFVAERERLLGKEGKSLLAAASRAEVPVFTSSPGDSSIGMNVAALSLAGKLRTTDPARDVEDLAAILAETARRGGRNAVWILGGGSPKSFALQAEAYVRSVEPGLEAGFDAVVQVTDARPDSGGLSGAEVDDVMASLGVPSRAGRRTATCNVDSTIALPLLAAYALDRRAPREPRRWMRELHGLHDRK